MIPRSLLIERNRVWYLTVSLLARMIFSNVTSKLLRGYVRSQAIEHHTMAKLKDFHLCGERANHLV